MIAVIDELEPTMKYVSVKRRAKKQRCAKRDVFIRAHY